MKKQSTWQQFVTKRFAYRLQERIARTIQLIWQWFWRQDHNHGAAVHFWILLHRCNFFGFFNNPFEQIFAKLGKCNFASPENDCYLNLVLSFNKLFDMIDLGLQIVFAGLWSYLYFLELKRSLFLFRFLSLLGQFIFITTIIHYFADRRVSVGRNFHQVKTKIIGNSNCLVSGDNADLIAFRVYYSDLFCPDISINIYSIWSVWPVFMFR